MVGCDRLLSYGDVVLRTDDLDLLKPGRWLNDRLITFCVQYLVDNAPPDVRDQIAVICAPECEMIKFMPDAVQSIFGELKLRNKRMVLFIVNDNDAPDTINGGNHWSVLAYFWSTQTFYYFDSLNRRNENVARLISKNASVLVSESKTEPRFEHKECAQQTNGSDCGVFAVEFVRDLVQHVRPGVLFAVPAQFATERREWWTELITRLAAEQNNM